jgi:hypothetical protein
MLEQYLKEFNHVIKTIAITGCFIKITTTIFETSSHFLWQW